MQLLIAIAVFFRAPIRFPEYVKAQMLVVQKRENQLKKQYITEQLTTTQTELGVKVCVILSSVNVGETFAVLLDYLPSLG